MASSNGESLPLDRNSYGFVISPTISALGASVEGQPGISLSAWTSAFPRKNYKRSFKLRRYCRRGVPREIRIDVWSAVSGVSSLMNNDSPFMQLCSEECSQKCLTVIDLDLRRTLPDNIYFSEQKYRTKLKLILIAFANFRKNIGYCQGMNYIAAAFLLLGASEENSFLLLDNVIDLLTPPDYFDKTFIGLLAEKLVLKSLAAKHCRDAFDVLASIQDYDMIFDKWFICLYFDILPLELVYRIWDCLFYDGFKYFHRVAIYLIRKIAASLKPGCDISLLMEVVQHLKTDPSLYEYSSFISNVYSSTKGVRTKEMLALRAKHRKEVAEELKSLKPERRPTVRIDGSVCLVAVGDDALRPVAEEDVPDYRERSQEFVISQDSL